MLWIKYTIGQNFSKYFEYNLSIITLIRLKIIIKIMNIIRFFIFLLKKFCLAEKGKKIVRALSESEYRTLKRTQGDFFS